MNESSSHLAAVGKPPRVIHISTRPAPPPVEKVQRHPTPSILRRVSAPPENVRVIVINNSSGLGAPSGGSQFRRVVANSSSMQSILNPGAGPGNLVSQAPGEKRLVRKFCLVSPHKRVSNSEPPQTRIRLMRPRYSPEELPKLGRPMKIPIPKVLKSEFNADKNRTERIVVLPAREVRITEAQTQTEDSEPLVCLAPLSPRLVLSANKEENKEMVNGKRGRQLAFPSDSTSPSSPSIKRQCPSPPPKPQSPSPPIQQCPYPPIPQQFPYPPRKPQGFYPPTQTTSENKAEVQESPMDRHSPLPSVSENDPLDPTFQHCLIEEVKLPPPPLESKVPHSRDEIVKMARLDFENCMVPDHMGNLPLHRAVVSKNVANIKRQCIVMKATCGTVDMKNHGGMTALHLALIQDCDLSIVHKLLKYGASLDATDNLGNTHLHLAVDHASLSVLEFLIPLMERYVNKLNEEGLSPLHLAIIDGKLEQTNLLVKCKETNVNLGDGKSGRTPLFHALEGSHTNLARILVKHGGCRQVSNFAGQSVMTLGAESYTFKRALKQVTNLGATKKKHKGKHSKGGPNKSVTLEHT